LPVKKEWSYTSMPSHLHRVVFWRCLTKYNILRFTWRWPETCCEWKEYVNKKLSVATASVFLIKAVYTLRNRMHATRIKLSIN
jgi:hypothetical protein